MNDMYNTLSVPNVFTSSSVHGICSCEPQKPSKLCETNSRNSLGIFILHHSPIITCGKIKPSHHVAADWEMARYVTPTASQVLHLQGSEHHFHLPPLGYKRRYAG